MEDYDADAAFARRLIEFDADDPATHSPWTLPQPKLLMARATLTR